MSQPSTDSKDVSRFEVDFKQDYLDDFDIHRKYVQSFDPLEAMLTGQVYDAVSNSVDSNKITDSYTATLAIERAARVMGKLPDGRTEAIGKGQQGQAAFLDILRQKWLYPNMNSQFPFETKMEMSQLYSTVYGYFIVFEDWNIAASGYIGPDVWLWNPRNLVFQQGHNFFEDMDYVTALTWVGKKFLQDVLDNGPEEDDEDPVNDGWDREALKELISMAGKTTADPDTEKDTLTERNRTPQGTKKGIQLATRYEAGDDGEWITFAPDHGFMEVRRLKNPHGTGRIPFRILYDQELYDSVYGMGDFQRAKPLQFARDGLTNYYFKGIKMNLIPPVVVNANGVMKHTIDYREGGVMMETIPNSIRTLNTSNAGLATYQGAQSNLTGSLLSLFGTQNASMPGAETLNPTQGKTPAAINMYSDKEASRDGRARKRLETFIEQITDDCFAMIAHMGTETIPVNLFAKDLEAIEQSGLKDVGELFENFTPNAYFTGGEIRIDPEKFRDTEFKFHITPGSTAKIDQDAQRQELKDIMDTIAKHQNAFKDDPSIAVNWGAIMKAYESMSNIPGASQFVTIRSQEEVQKIQAQAAQANQAPQKSPTETLNYKDAPADIQRQIEQQAGLQPSQLESPSTTKQAVDHSVIIKNHVESQQADAAHELAVAGHELNTVQAADQSRQAEAAAQPEPTPATFSGGGAYHDPLMAAAAEHISKLS